MLNKQKSWDNSHKEMGNKKATPKTKAQNPGRRTENHKWHQWTKNNTKHTIHTHITNKHNGDEAEDIKQICKRGPERLRQ